MKVLQNHVRRKWIRKQTLLYKFILFYFVKFILNNFLLLNFYFICVLKFVIKYFVKNYCWVLLIYVGSSGYITNEKAKKAIKKETRQSQYIRK